MKILVVDDEKTLVKGIKFNLENEGYHVECAYDGAAAVELARNNKFDLLILDVISSACRILKLGRNVDATAAPFMKLRRLSSIVLPCWWEIFVIISKTYGSDNSPPHHMRV